MDPAFPDNRPFRLHADTQCTLSAREEIVILGGGGGGGENEEWAENQRTRERGKFGAPTRRRHEK
eukprot:767502-Hanusia_phi.AAC.5